MSADEQDLRWKIDNVREAISLDWKNLASKNLSADQRKAIREHLNICNDSLKTLKDLVERNRAASQKSKLEIHQRLRRSSAD
jgi:hypothetical protein